MPSFQTPDTLPKFAGIRTARAVPQAVIAITAGPEPEILVRCLGALALQRNQAGLWLAPEAFGVVVAPTGPAEPMLRAVARLGPALPFSVRVLPPGSGPGWALPAAMIAAADWLVGRGPVLALAAEAVAASHWLLAAHDAMVAGADLVLGAMAGPGAAARHAALLAMLEARLDPDWVTGAAGQATNFGIRAEVLPRPGGLPAGPDGGLPALLARLRARDARIVRVPTMLVEAPPPATAESVLALRRRALARRALRQFWEAGTGTHAPETPAFRRWATCIGLPPGALGRALAAPRFDLAWTAAEAASPVLAERRVLPPTALRRDILLARLLLARLPATPPAPVEDAPVQRAGAVVPGGIAPAGICMLR